MPIPRRVGQWNKVGLNRLTRHIAPWMPGFGVVVHRRALAAGRPPHGHHGTGTAPARPPACLGVITRRPAGLGASRPAAMRTREKRLAGQDSGAGAVWPPAAPGMVDT